MAYLFRRSCIRTTNIPVLFVHGGPASPLTPTLWQFQRPIEEYFTMVTWDQRGAGKTYLANDPAQVRPTMSITRMVDDAEEVAAHLRKTYGKRRIILMAHSFGTIVGLRLAQRQPDWFYAYVGTGQFIDFQASEAAGFAATLADARAAKNGQAIEDLTRIAPFPPCRATAAIDAATVGGVLYLGIKPVARALFDVAVGPEAVFHNLTMLPLAPRQVLFTADASDAVPAQYTQRVVLDARERRRDTRHPWPPVRVGDFSTTILTGGRVLRKCSKCSYGAALRLK